MALNRIIAIGKLDGTASALVNDGFSEPAKQANRPLRLKLPVKFRSITFVMYLNNWCNANVSLAVGDYTLPLWMLLQTYGLSHPGAGLSSFLHLFSITLPRKPLQYRLNVDGPSLQFSCSPGMSLSIGHSQEGWAQRSRVSMKN